MTETRRDPCAGWQERAFAAEAALAIAEARAEWAEEGLNALAHEIIGWSMAPWPLEEIVEKHVLPLLGGRLRPYSGAGSILAPAATEGDNGG